MFAGAAGAVYAHLPPGYIHPNNYTVIEMVTFLAMVVLGGLGHIWGGIIGDDGIEGIELGDETPEGEAFVRFQKYLKKLSKNGLILCVCSKNDEKIAKEVFKKHKSMVLKLDDVSIFVANYNDKATNIKKISKTLNLGLDSFIFIDDSKIECSIVKKELPDVSVVNVSNDPSEFIKIIERLNLFNFRNVTDEDINRVQSYKKIMDITTVSEMIAIAQALPDKLIKNCMLFIMRKNITPRWEDPCNREGGCFSFKVTNKNVPIVWKHVSYLLVGESLCKLNNIINGITISPKRSFCIVKIWLRDCKHQSPSILANIPELATQGCLFKRHNPEN